MNFCKNLTGSPIIREIPFFFYFVFLHLKFSGFENLISGKYFSSRKSDIVVEVHFPVLLKRYQYTPRLVSVGGADNIHLLHTVDYFCGSAVSD